MGDATARSPETALEAYVALPDAAFRWVEVAQLRHLGTDTRLIELTSQRWRDTLWRHQLWLIDPTEGRGARHEADWPLLPMVNSAVRAMVDPYRYRERLTQPKLLVLASNDAY